MLRQDTRLLRLRTAVPGAPLLVDDFSHREGVSTLAETRIRCFCEESPIPLADFPGKAVTLSIRPAGDESERHVSGYIRDAAEGGRDEVRGWYYYDLLVVPWLWFLTRKVDSRIFQDRSSMEIAEEIFQDFGFSDYQSRLVDQPPPRPFSVQFRETCYNFLCRLFEEDGLYFYFSYEGGRQILVIGNSSNAAEDGGPLTFRRLEMGDSEPGVSGLSETSALRPSAVSLSDYNFETPTRSLLVSTTSQISNEAASDLELFDHPGRYEDVGAGETRAKIRIQAQEAASRILSGQSNVPTISCGRRHAIQGHPDGAKNRGWFITSARHGGSNNWDGADAEGARYSNTFEAIPDDVTFRPPRVTPRPIVEGPQTAFVVGVNGEEIDTDEYARVKVQFHWDRPATGDERCSCWIRVAQGLAGARWGGLFVPRIGMEVVVDFLDGDPDRPLVTGTVYNAENMPPASLPDEKTKSLLRTSGTPGGAGFNELCFEDKAGSEQILMQAQKDMDVKVLNDRRDWVGHDAHRHVVGDTHEQTDGDQHMIVKEEFKAKIDDVYSLRIGGDREEEISETYALKTGREYVLDAGTSITLKSGGSFIRVTPGGIVVKGPMIRLNSGGSASGRRASPDAPEAPADAASNVAGTPPQPPAPRRLKPLTAGARPEVEPQAAALREAAEAGSFLVENCPAAT